MTNICSSIWKPKLIATTYLPCNPFMKALRICFWYNFSMQCYKKQTNANFKCLKIQEKKILPKEENYSGVSEATVIMVTQSLIRGFAFI